MNELDPYVVDPYYGIPAEVVGFASRGHFSTAAVVANYHLQHRLPLIAAANNIEDPALLPPTLVQRVEDHAYQQLVHGHLTPQSIVAERLHRDVFDLAGIVVGEYPFDLGNDTLVERGLPIAVEEYRRRHYR